MTKPKPGFQWYVICGGIIVSIASVILTQFLIMPLKDRMAKDAAVRNDYPYLQKEVVALKAWQTEMQTWKEDVLASGAINYQLRQVIVAMPEAPKPVPVAGDSSLREGAKLIPTTQLLKRIK
jgi:hypothetical protein